MTIAGLPPIHLQPSQDAVRKPEHAARISFRQPVSTAGFVDAAWWPRSLDLTAELPPLLDVLWTAVREITRITYNTSEWNPAPRRMVVEGRTVRLGGFTTTEPHTARLSDAWGQERIDILIIDPATDPATARRVLLLASQADNPYRAREIFTRASSYPRPLQ
jgi:Family of unknown function (DUF5994)